MLNGTDSGMANTQNIKPNDTRASLLERENVPKIPFVR